LRIIGIDPGSRICGWGIIEKTEKPNSIRHVDCGLIAPKTSRPFQKRLGIIYSGLREVINEYRPEQAGIENVFFAKNAKSALILGQARGVAILSMEHEGLTVAEYSPTEIKSAVCGFGHAGKEQVARMVMAILKLPEPAQTDASDALACAICHCNSYKMLEALKKSR